MLTSLGLHPPRPAPPALASSLAAHKSGNEGLGFRVWGLGFRVQGFGFRVQGMKDYSPP